MTRGRTPVNVSPSSLRRVDPIAQYKTTPLPQAESIRVQSYASAQPLRTIRSRSTAVAHRQGPDWRPGSGGAVRPRTSRKPRAGNARGVGGPPRAPVLGLSLSVPFIREEAYVGERNDLNLETILWIPSAPPARTRAVRMASVIRKTWSWRPGSANTPMMLPSSVGMN